MSASEVQTLVAQLTEFKPNYAYAKDGVEWRWPYLVILSAEISYLPAIKSPPGALRFEGIELWQVQLHCELRDRSTGELRDQLFSITFATEQYADLPDDERRAKLLREAYLKVACHELDELLRVTRLWVDPHP